MNNPDGSPRTRFLRVLEVAESLSVSTRSVWRAIKKGDLRVVRIGRAVRIPLNGPGSLSEYVEKGGSR